ncbi:MAG TPA: hypothetical protein VED01_13855 [Burkholderiales bacterium]|nr:hypothetical protein [Burkholderiales bacterium]
MSNPPAYIGFRSMALAAALAFAACSESPPPSAANLPSIDPARPRDATANLPSDSGSHSALATGAVTGAGLAQGTTVQPDIGAPGGLEPRARAKQRAAEAGHGGAAGAGTGGGADSRAAGQP